MNIRQKERIFFYFTHAITILSLFTYSVCDEKLKTGVLLNATEVTGTYVVRLRLKDRSNMSYVLKCF